MSIEEYQKADELKLMQAYKTLKKLLKAVDAEEVPTFEQFKVIYEEELSEASTKH